MELRHLKYFVAVAEEGGLTLAAERRLHTAQPSLSRQMRDLERDVGVQLLVRNARGVELTDAGKVFLDHARLALAQVNSGREAARRAAKPLKPLFAVGFLSGHEVNWLQEATRLLGRELQRIEMAVYSENSPELADGLSNGRLDVAFMRAEPNRPDLSYIPIASEPFVVIMPSDHRLAKKQRIDARDLASEVFIGASNLAGPMRMVVEDYLIEKGLAIEPAHRIHGDVSRRINSRRGAASGLCRKLPAFCGDQQIS